MDESVEIVSVRMCTELLGYGLGNAGALAPVVTRYTNRFCDDITDITPNTKYNP